jgi:hypothetical protein
VTIAFRRGQAPKRGPWLPVGTSIGTRGAPWVPLLALVPGDQDVITRSDGLSTTDSERQHQFQPVY